MENYVLLKAIVMQKFDVLNLFCFVGVVVVVVVVVVAAFIIFLRLPNVRHICCVRDMFIK